MSNKSLIVVAVLALAGLVYLAMPQEKPEQPRLEAILEDQAPFC